MSVVAALLAVSGETGAFPEYGEYRTLYNWEGTFGRGAGLWAAGLPAPVRQG